MASSTTNPVARVMPNKVSVLMENPSSRTNRNVPTSETGMVAAGMIVLCQSCRNKKMTRMTRTIASSRVISTSWMDSATAVVVSKATAYFSPGGKCLESSASTARESRSTCSALALESWVMPKPMIGWLLYSRMLP